MKSFITRKTTLFAISGLAVGLAGLTAQDDPRQATDRDKQTGISRTQDAQQETFRGQLVSLTAYMGKHQDWKADKAGESKDDATTSADRERSQASSANKAMSTYQPIGLLVDTGTDIDVDTDADREGGADRNRGQASAQNRERTQRAGVTPQVQQLCVLLFSPDNQELAAKAKALCEMKDDVSAKKPAAARGDDTPEKAEQETDRSGSTLGTKTKDMHKVAIKGKKVMRHGLTAIFVEDIEGTDLSAQN